MNIQEKIEICKKYVAKSSFIGGCDFVFGINTKKESEHYGKIALIFTVNKEYVTMKIPDFVDYIGVNEKEDIYEGCYIAISSEDKTFKHIGYSQDYKYAFNFLNADNVILGKNTSVINESAFVHSYVKNVTVNINLKEICEGAFEYCTYMTSIDLENIKDGATIGYNAFSNCKQLIKADLSKVIKIGNKAFYGCVSLEQVKFSTHNDFKLIKEGAFAYCKSLTDVYIPNNVERIEEMAFFKSYKLKNIRI